MVTTFNGNPSATVISWYSPTNVSEETDLSYYPSRATRQICLNGLELCLEIDRFRPNRICPMVEALLTRTKILVPSVYCTVINYAFTFRTKMLLVNSTALWISFNSWSISSRIRIRCTFNFMAFKPDKLWTHHLPRYYEPQPLNITAWTASVIGLVSLLNGISTFVGYLMPKPFS